MPSKMQKLLDREWKDTDLMGLKVTLKSKTGKSLLEKGVRVTRSNYKYFLTDPQKLRESRQVLEKEGFKVLTDSGIGLSVVGEKKLIQDYFKTQIGVRTVEVKHGEKAFKIRMPDATIKLPRNLTGIADRIQLEQYPIPLESATPPAVDYYHLNVPDDIANLMHATELHSCGYDGTGIKLCMIDDGFYSHAYYTSRGYNITLIPVVLDDMQAGKGHGTAIAANALAIAPNAEFIFLNNQAWIFSIVTAAFRLAKEQNPDVITCSWGLYDYDVDLAWEIVDAVNRGMVVTFACGNEGPIYFPGCMDEVISVGGVYPVEDDGLRASTYASSGECDSNVGRQCPDVCGIVGDDPHGVLIMMPTVPDEFYDNEFSDYDGTTSDDGWLCGSGTSSAAPQVAGVAALLLQCDPTLTPNAVKSVLQNTATDIVLGTSASGEPTGAGVDLATGYGLVHAADALNSIGCSCDDCGITIQTGYCKITTEVFCRYSELCIKNLETCTFTSQVCPRLEICTVSTEYCRPANMTGCIFEVMTGQGGGCGPASLIVDVAKWWEVMQSRPEMNPIMIERLARKLQLPKKGIHTRKLTRTVPGQKGCTGIRTKK